MNKNIFRKKSIDRVSSPEALNEYIKIIHPPVWILLGAVIILILGALIWGIFGRLDTNIRAAAFVENGKITAYIGEGDRDRVTPGMEISIEGEHCRLSEIDSLPIKAADINEYALHKGGLMSEWIFCADVEGTVPDGIYEGLITVEKISPISFLFNT